VPSVANLERGRVGYPIFGDDDTVGVVMGAVRVGSVVGGAPVALVAVGTAAVVVAGDDVATADGVVVESADGAPASPHAASVMAPAHDATTAVARNQDCSDHMGTP
jgi:hypothetical protein